MSDPFPENITPTPIDAVSITLAKQVSLTIPALTAAQPKIHLDAETNYDGVTTAGVVLIPWGTFAGWGAAPRAHIMSPPPSSSSASHFSTQKPIPPALSFNIAGATATHIPVTGAAAGTTCAYPTTAAAGEARIAITTQVFDLSARQAKATRRYIIVENGGTKKVFKESNELASVADPLPAPRFSFEMGQTQ